MSTNGADLASGLSANELRLLAAAWISCGEATPKPNYDVVARICGYKNAGSASVMFGGVRRKLAAAAAHLQTNGTDADQAETDVKPTVTKKRKATTTTADSGPKKRGRKPKVNEPAPEPASDDNQGDSASAEDVKMVVKAEGTDESAAEDDIEPDL